MVDLYAALTDLPKPSVNLYDYWIDDSTAISANNNGNGVIDAGETVRLYISLHNQGGVASNVQVTLDTLRSSGVVDPYFTIVNSSIQLSDIGTYSVRESGELYFEIQVGSDCPNDYLVDFNIHYTYTNGMDSQDTTVYRDDGKEKAQFNVSNGYHLPGTITEDTVFTNDRLYIVSNDVLIPAGVTVTFQEGCRIQFYDDSEYYNSPVINVYGTLKIEGTKENMVQIYPNERHSTFICKIVGKKIDSTTGGTIQISYADAINLIVNETGENSNINVTPVSTKIANSVLRQQCAIGYSECYVYCYYASKVVHIAYFGELKDNYIDELLNSEVDIFGYHLTLQFGKIQYCQLNILGNDHAGFSVDYMCTDNVIAIKKEDFHGVGRSSCFEFGGVYSNACYMSNNLFLTAFDSLEALPALKFYGTTVTAENNTFSPLYQQYASQIIEDYYNTDGTPIIDVYGSCSDITKLWPYVVSVELLDKNGDPVTAVGWETITVRVTFNRPMDTTKDTYLTFGTEAPYADYRIEGSYVSDTVWEGTYTLKAQIENGQNFLKVNNACAADDPVKTVLGEYNLHEFTIDTTAALSMNLTATATNGGIKLTWVQDDYDTLMGYNIYRCEEKDGNFVKINPAVLLATESEFVDDNAEPGKTYWYTFTVVLSDFSESALAGKVSCTAYDSVNPTVYHTPFNQGYLGNNLVISCIASDNMQIASVSLYYRTVGSEQWKKLDMSKVNDKYSATIFGSELDASGLEYYISAFDGTNTVTKGSADTPYRVVIKDASAISRLGDVDGDGTITTKDALMIMQSIEGKLILSDDQFKRADLNGDGILSSAEALRILQYINGKIGTVEM